MIRPPVPPVFFFLLDVSVAAVKSGMLRTACSQIKKMIEDKKLPPSTEVGFITFDHQISIFQFKPG